VYFVRDALAEQASAGGFALMCVKLNSSCSQPFCIVMDRMKPA
jgi:hypothetical protein